MDISVLIEILNRIGAKYKYCDVVANDVNNDLRIIGVHPTPEDENGNSESPQPDKYNPLSLDEIEGLLD